MHWQRAVGYGDVVPITPQGKWVAGLTMMTGLLLLSLPISVIGQNFTDVLGEYMAEWEEMRALQMEVGFCYALCVAVFCS